MIADRRRALGVPLVTPGSRPGAIEPTGVVKNLVILCEFKDHKASPDSYTRPQADYDTFFNSVVPAVPQAPSGSVRDYFLQNSYGAMTLDSSVVAWVTLPQNEVYYSDGEGGMGAWPNNSQRMIRDALDLVDLTVDFGDFDTDNDGYVDAIDFIHSGYDAAWTGDEDHIWSHLTRLNRPNGVNREWTSADENEDEENVKVDLYHTEAALRGASGNAICPIVTTLHETGHYFGLPDLYDTDKSSKGIGSWGLMGGKPFYTDESDIGDNPSHLCAWSKIQFGWITPAVAAASGSYTLRQAETHPDVLKISSGYPENEYLLIENRQPAGFESKIPQGGLAVWHIDDTKGTIDGNDVNDDEGYPGQEGWP